jgi:predicted ATP-binding protein involved in virulence
VLNLFILASFTDNMKRDIAPFKVNGQSHIILQQLSCGTRSKVSFVSNPAQISLKHSSQLTNKTTLATPLKSYLRTDCI